VPSEFLSPKMPLQLCSAELVSFIDFERAEIFGYDGIMAVGLNSSSE